MSNKLVKNENNKDLELEKNQELEQAIKELQEHPTEELLAHTLTVLRRRMKEEGHFIVAVEAGEGEQISMKTVNTPDGGVWFAAFTSFDEQLKGDMGVMSAFTAPIHQLFQMALQAPEVQGLIVNPWNRTLMLDKNLIHITIGA